MMGNDRSMMARVAALLLVTVAPQLLAADEPSHTRQQDVIYGRKYGVAAAPHSGHRSGEARRS